MAPLTRREKQLRSEVEQIAAAINVDIWEIENYDRKGRITRLQIMKDKLIRSEVISKYTLIDEFLTVIICDYFFRRRLNKKEATYRKLWKTRPFQIFAHYIMDETYLPKKMDIVHTIKPIPKNVKSAIHRINDARNALAHSFFPENRRRYMADKKVVYNGADLFSCGGLVKFIEDFRLSNLHLSKRAFGSAFADALHDLYQEDTPD